MYSPSEGLKCKRISTRTLLVPCLGSKANVFSAAKAPLPCAAPIRASVCLPCYHPAEITIPAVILMQNDELSVWRSCCKSHSPARPPAFPFDSSFHRRLSSFMFPSIPCTCPLENLCIINDSPAFSFRLCPPAPRRLTLGLACVEQHSDTSVKEGRGPLVDRWGQWHNVKLSTQR